MYNTQARLLDESENNRIEETPNLTRKPSVGMQLRTVFSRSWVNGLLVFVPIGFTLYYANLPNSDIPIFIANFIAIVPLAALLSDATEEIARHVGETSGGLLNASLG